MPRKINDQVTHDGNSQLENEVTKTTKQNPTNSPSL